VAVSSWKLAWLDCKHRLGFPEVIDDISGTIHLLHFVWKVIVWKQAKLKVNIILSGVLTCFDIKLMKIVKKDRIYL